MSVTATATGLRGISLVCVPTLDQDAAVEFYERLGFEKRTDQEFGGGYRWIEVYLSGSGTGIALAPPPPPGSGDIVGTQTGITLTTSDVDSTHAKMKSLGVDVDAEVSHWATPSRRCSGSATPPATR